MTWPFGGLPLGGVFLGQADGPLLQLARIGGPLLLTAGVWAGGVARWPAAVRSGTWAAGLRGGAVAAVRGAALLVGLGLAVVLGSLAPDGGPTVRSISVAAVQGGGRRGVDKEQVRPGHRLRGPVARHSTARRPDAATVARAVARGRHRPGRPLRVPAQDAHHGGGWPGVCTRPCRRGDRARVAADHVPQRDRGLGPRRADRRHLREGAPGPLRRVRPLPVLHLALRQPVRRPDRRHPGPRHGPARAHPPARSAPSSPSRSSTPTAAARRCGPGPSC